MDKDSIIATYSRDIARYGGILDDCEQKDLAESITYNKSISKIYAKSLNDKNLSIKSRERLKLEYDEIESKINSARETLAITNLPFVIAKARKFAGRNVDILDLIQEGSLKLYQKATDMYDPNHSSNSKFTSYAGWWVDHSMRRTLSNQSRHIRLPVHASDLERKIKLFTDNFVNENLRAPSSEEISEGIEEKLKKVNEMQINERLRDTLSLDYQGDNDHSTLLDTISYDPQQEMDGQMNFHQAGIIEKLLKTAKLTEKERLIIDDRFGLESGNARTLAEVGDELKLTRERIRQIETMSLKKLKRAAKKMNLNFEDLF